MAIVALVVNVAAALILVRSLALGGLALANSLAVLSEVALGLWWLRQVFDGAHAQALWAVVWRSLAAAAVLALVVSSLIRLPMIASLSEGGTTFGAALALAIGGAAGALAYAFASFILGLRLSRAGLTVISEAEWSAP
jgi:putative peptidoglycan lipid II flippase